MNDDKEDTQEQQPEPSREEKFPNKMPDIYQLPIPNPIPDIFGF